MNEYVRELLESAFDPKVWCFHQWRHTLVDVVPGLAACCNRINAKSPGAVSDEAQDEALRSGEFHDVNQVHEVKLDKCMLIVDGKVCYVLGSRLLRKPGMNDGESERESFRVAEGWLAKNGYTPERIGRIRVSIGLTKPEWDKDLGTVFQKIWDGCPLSCRLLPLVDTGHAGRNSAKFMLGGPQLFGEDNRDFFDVCANVDRHGPSWLDEQDQVQVYLMNGEPLKKIAYADAWRGRLMFWHGGQGKFARGRKEYFAKDTAGLIDPVVAALKAEFACFEQSSDMAEDFAKGLQSRTTWEIMRITRQVALLAA